MNEVLLRAMREQDKKYYEGIQRLANERMIAMEQLLEKVMSNTLMNPGQEVRDGQ